jgi:hypothetical protein
MASPGLLWLGLFPHHEGAELAVCDVDVSERAAMEHHRELGGRDEQRLDAADRASRSAGDGGTSQGVDR